MNKKKWYEKDDRVRAFRKRIKKIQEYYIAAAISEIGGTIILIGVMAAGIHYRLLSSFDIYFPIIIFFTVLGKLVFAIKATIKLQKIRKFALKKQKALPADPYLSGILGIFLPFAIYFAWAYIRKIYLKSEEFLQDVDLFDLDLDLDLFEERASLTILDD